MSRLALKERQTFSMDQSDIKYVIELLTDAVTSRDWDAVEEAKEALKEFLDSDVSHEEEQQI